MRSSGYIVAFTSPEIAMRPVSVEQIETLLGGHHVTSSARRAAALAKTFDRLAVGVITVTNSPERAHQTPAVHAPRPRQAETDRGICAPTLRTRATVGSFRPDPRTSEGAGGRPCIPSSDAVRAKSERLHRLSSVGPAAPLGVDDHKSEQAAPNSRSRSHTSSHAVVMPETHAVPPVVSGTNPNLWSIH